MRVWSLVILIFCFYTTTAQLIDSSSNSPKWIWWGYTNSKMPFAVVTDVSLDSKNKVWLSFCDSQYGGIANFTKTDMSDFYHFNRYTKPGFFGTYNCVLSLATGKNDTAYFATFRSSSTRLYSAIDTQIVNNYGCLVSGEFQKIRYIQRMIHATTTSGLLRVGDSICEVLRPTGLNPALPPVPLNDYGYYKNDKLIITNMNETNGFYYKTDTGWAKVETGYYGRYRAFWASPDYYPGLSGQGYIYFTMLDSGLFLMKNGAVSRFMKEELGTASDRIIVVKEDKNGVLWVGTSGGLAIFKNESWQNFNLLMPWLDGAYITNIQFDYRGNTWISSNSGLTVYNPKGVYWDGHKPNIPQIKVYPNPFDTEIKIETDPDYIGVIHWELYNIYGRQVGIGTIYKPETSYLPELISLPPLQAGIYILRCKLVNDHNISTKLLKL